MKPNISLATMKNVKKQEELNKAKEESVIEGLAKAVTELLPRKKKKKKAKSAAIGIRG